MQYEDNIGRGIEYSPTQLNKHINSMKFNSVADRIRYKRRLMGIG